LPRLRVSVNQAIALETYTPGGHATPAPSAKPSRSIARYAQGWPTLIEAGKAGLRETGRPTKGAKVGTATALPKLKDYGIGRHESQRWQKLAKVRRTSSKRRSLI